MQNILFQGRHYPIEIKHHHLKRSNVEVHDDKLVFNICYDLSTNQQREQLKILIDKLYSSYTKEIVKNGLNKHRSIQPRPISKVRLKKLRSRWGSASENNNLNFNLHLSKLPPNCQSYIVAHEYAHLFEMNHSKAFWAKVAEFDPNYRENRRQLRNFEKTVLRNHQF